MKGLVKAHKNLKTGHWVTHFIIERWFPGHGYYFNIILSFYICLPGQDRHVSDSKQPFSIFWLVHESWTFQH